MMALFVFALALGFLAIVLSIHSNQNNGLCDYSNSTVFYFAWRFFPTMIAVLYALAVTALINDVKRTEASAKLSKPNGASAFSSLFMSSGPWWEDPMKALSKKGNNGRRSWRQSRDNFHNESVSYKSDNWIHCSAMRAKYFVAYNVTTSVSDTPTGSLISIDDDGFNRTKVDLDSSTIDLRSFETQFLDLRWANHFRNPDKVLSIYDEYSIRLSLGGPLILLAATMADPGSDLDPLFDAPGFLD